MYMKVLLMSVIHANEIGFAVARGNQDKDAAGKRKKTVIRHGIEGMGGRIWDTGRCNRRCLFSCCRLSSSVRMAAMIRNCCAINSDVFGLTRENMKRF